MKKYLVALFIVAFAVLAFGQVTGKYLGFTANRYWDNNGVLKTDSRIETYGVNNAFRLTYSPGVYTDVVENSSGNIYIAKNLDNGDSSRVLYLESAPVLLTDGVRQGTLVVNVSRASGYAMTASGGASDLGQRITVTNRSASVDYARIRGLEINVETRDTGAGSFLQEGAYIGVKSRSGTSINASGDLIAIKAETNHGASGGNNVIGLMVNMIDQAVTPGGGYYGIKIQTAAYAVTRLYAIHIGSSAGSFTNGISFNNTITNVFDFGTADGTNGAYVGTYTNNIVATNPSGYIQIDVNGTPYFIPMYATRPS